MQYYRAYGSTAKRALGRQSSAYRDVVLCNTDSCVTELLVADLQEAALLAGCAKAVERRVEHVTPEVSVPVSFD